MTSATAFFHCNWAIGVPVVLVVVGILSSWIVRTRTQERLGSLNEMLRLLRVGVIFLAAFFMGILPMARANEGSILLCVQAVFSVWVWAFSCTCSVGWGWLSALFRKEVEDRPTKAFWYLVSLGKVLGLYVIIVSTLVGISAMMLTALDCPPAHPGSWDADRYFFLGVIFFFLLFHALSTHAIGLKKIVEIQGDTLEAV